MTPPSQLQVVPIAALHPHESTEPARVARLTAELRALGHQQHPVLAAPVGSRWLLLDGHHRVGALAALGIDAVLAQQVDLDAGVEVGAWTHEVASEIGDVGAGARALGSGGTPVARIHTARGSTEHRSARTDLAARVAAMHELAGRYAGLPYRRVTRREPWARSAAARVEYAALSVRDCLLLVERGLALPAGVTRFVVTPRILNVRMPLARLAGSGPAGPAGPAGTAAQLGGAA
ncbi:MAG TPA: ParB N-terminal domain-containing protein [Mycobacteriales bacterium]|nr:ParB N-terminal domain-containing protein [Mycobacteriales bacterium]